MRRRSAGLSPAHRLWCHFLHSWQRTELLPTFRPHFPHGYAAGPGFSSTSPARSSSEARWARPRPASKNPSGSRWDVLPSLVVGGCVEYGALGSPEGETPSPREGGSNDGFSSWLSLIIALVKAFLLIHPILYQNK